MSARTFVPASPADERGIALLTTILMMVLIGGLLVLAQGSAVAPFIYTLF